jgi:hypothetical protein
MMHDVAQQAATEVARTLQHDSTFVRGSVDVKEMLSDIFCSILDAVPTSTADKDGKDWQKATKRRQHHQDNTFEAAVHTKNTYPPQSTIRGKAAGRHRISKPCFK